MRSRFRSEPLNARVSERQMANNSVSHPTASGGAPWLFAPQPRYVPMTTNIASGQVFVRHGAYVNYRITITPEMRDPVVGGSFTAAAVREMILLSSCSFRVS